MPRFARPRSPDGHSRASTLELFYDLVFVFAVTQISDVYTYLHSLIVAGVIVSAIGDEIVILDPSESLDTPHLIAVVAGPGIYLLALALLRLRAAGTVSVRRPLAAVLIVLIGLVAQDASALLISVLILTVLVTLIAVEEWAFQRRLGAAAPAVGRHEH